MPVTLYLLVLLIAASGTLMLAESACAMNDCGAIETLHGFAALGLPVLVLYALLTLGLLYRLAVALEARHGRLRAALYPSALLSALIVLGATDPQRADLHQTLVLLGSLAIPWFVAALAGLVMRAGADA